jgi:hypothetical protein
VIVVVVSSGSGGGGGVWLGVLEGKEEQNEKFWLFLEASLF